MIPIQWNKVEVKTMMIPLSFNTLSKEFREKHKTVTGVEFIFNEHLEEFIIKIIDSHKDNPQVAIRQNEFEENPDKAIKFMFLKLERDFYNH